jgi:hypothetical protein
VGVGIGGVQVVFAVFVLIVLGKQVVYLAYRYGKYNRYGKQHR